MKTQPKRYITPSIEIIYAHTQEYILANSGDEPDDFIEPGVSNKIWDEEFDANSGLWDTETPDLWATGSTGNPFSTDLW